MITFIPILNITIFFLLSALHFYWAFGGTKGRKVSIPTDSNGRKLFNPSFSITIFIAVGFVFFAAVNVAYQNWMNLAATQNYPKYGMLVIGIIFLLRTIGDFNYIGLTKTHKQSKFAKFDTLLYIPFCLLLTATHFTAYWLA